MPGHSQNTLCGVRLCPRATGPLQYEVEVGRDRSVGRISQGKIDNVLVGVDGRAAANALASQTS